MSYKNFGIIHSMEIIFKNVDQTDKYRTQHEENPEIVNYICMD